MTDFHVLTRDALLDEIARAWAELNYALDRLTPEQLSGPTHAKKTPAEARAFLTETHDLLVALIAGLDEAALPLPFRALGPDEPPDRVIPPASHIIYESSAGHYREHLEWLRGYKFGAADGA